MDKSISDGDRTNSCIESVKFLNTQGQGAFQAFIIEYMCNQCTLLEDITLVHYVASRLQMLDKNFKKDPRALRRLVCEIVMVLCVYSSPGPQKTKKLAPLQIDESRFQSILDTYCTHTTIKILQKITHFTSAIDIIESLLAVKMYSIGVPVPYLTPAVTKDAILLVWKVMLDCVQKSQYISDMYRIFSTKYKKTLRNERAKILIVLLHRLKLNEVYESDMVITPAVIEAVMKCMYID